MNTKSNRLLTRRQSGLATAMLAGLALALTLTAVRAANVYLISSDGYGISSFNSAGNWSSGLAPSAGNSYYVTNGVTMRTPATATAYTFAGDVLYLFGTNTSTFVTMSLKGSNVITIPSLVLSNAIVQNSGTGYNPDTAIIAGNINVLTNSQINPSFSNRTLVVTAAISGSGGLTFKGSGTNQLNGSHTYNGPITESGVQVNMGSTFSMTPSSLTVGLDEFFYTATNWFSTTNIVAAGGSLNVNGGLSGVLQVGIRRLANTNNAVVALLDVSKQSQFTANVGNVIVGQNQDASGTGGGSCVGVMLLATNNTITTTNFLMGDALVSGVGSGTVTLGAGSNYIDTAILAVGQRKLTTLMTLPAGGTLVLTNSAGGGANVNVANNNVATGGTSVSTLDLSGGIVIATLNQLVVGQKNSPTILGNTGGATGTLTLSTNAANRVTATGITVGYMVQDASLSTGIATGNLTVGGGNVFVNDVTLGYLDYGGCGTSVGNLNINGGTFNVSNSITGGQGTANLNVNGGLLNMANNGTISVNNLVVNGIITNAGSITTTALTGSGSIVGSGTTTVSSTFSPGNTNTAGTLTVNSITFGSSAVLTYNLGPNTTVGSGSNDLLVVNGDLDLGNATLNIALLGSGLTTGTYTLATVTGNVFNSLTVPSTIGRYALTLSITGSSPAQVNLVVTGNPYSLLWTGANGSIWDIDTTQNWTNQLNIADYYFDYDKVLFNDTAATTAVELDVPVQPGSMTFSNKTTAYTLYTVSGAGAINGATSLTKQGTNSLTINTTNNFTGPVAINAGLLVAGNASALGATNGMVTIASGGTLDLNALSLGAKPVTVQGVGYNGNGAIINNNSNVAMGLEYVTLNGPTTLGCPFRWDISGYGTNGGFINGGTYTLTKTGPNALALHTGTAVTAGNIVVNQGYLILGDTATLNSGYPLTMAAGTTLQLYNQGLPLTRAVNLGTNATIQASSGSSNALVTGAITLNTVGNVNSDSTAIGLTLGGAVTRTGNLFINGVTPVVLTSLANNWTGGLIISNSPLYVGDGQTSIGSLPASLAITNFATLRWYPPTNTTITPSQDVVGTGTIEKQGSGTLVLNHAYSWTGPFNAGAPNSLFTTNGGIVQLLNGNGFGDGSSAKTVTIIRSEVDLSGGITIPAGISLRTSGFAAMTGDGAGLVPLRNVSGTNTVAGSIEAYYGVGNSEFNSVAGLLQLNGQVFLGNNTPRGVVFSGAGNGVVNGVINNQTTNALSVTMNGPGIWTFTATNTYAGATLVQGGTLLVNGAIGTNTVTVQTNSMLGGTGTIGGAVTYNTGSHAVLTLGSPLTLSSSLIVSNGADVHLKLTNNVPVGNYTLATYNVTGSSGAFSTSAVIDSGSLAGTSTGTIVTSGGIVQLQVTAAAPSSPPNFPPGGVSVLPSGNISLVATGAVGGTYKIWATTNLALTPITNTWTLLNSGTITTSPFTNTDLTATNYTQRFYLFSAP